MNEMSLAEAKSKRAHIKAATTRLKNFIDTCDTTQGSRHDITQRKQKLLDSWEQFEAIQSRIEVLENQDTAITDKDALLEQQISQRTSFENSYFTLMSRCEAIIEHYSLHEAAVVQVVNDHAIDARRNQIRLPKINLPVFSGSYEDWYSYHDTFEKLIHLNNSLSDIEKFHYLRSSLKDKAAEVIKSIEITTDNYQEAWASLNECYENKRWITQKHVRAIFEAPALIKENHVALRELLDTVLKHLRALNALKRPVAAWDNLIIYIIISKLDPATNKAWEISLLDSNIPDLKALTDFLSKRCQALETIFSKSSSIQTGNISHKHVSKNNFTSSTNLATSNLSCPQCKEHHHLYHCEAFLKLPTEKRIGMAKRAHLCINCLRSTSHQANTCNSSSCRKCNKKHNTLLHSASTSDDDKLPSISEQATAPINNPPLPVVTQCISDHRSLNILLSTAVINVHDSNKRTYSCRALLDSGSQINFITQELANRLHLTERSFETSIAGIMEGTFRTRKFVNLCIQSRFNSFRENIDCIILPKITQQLPQQFISTHDLAIPKNIKLADPNFNIPSNIDMLIGAELFWKLLCIGQIKLSKGQPILQKTHFGWILSGHMSNKHSSPSSSISCHLAAIQDLGCILKQFWEIDHNIAVPKLSATEQMCEELFQNNVKRNDQGRFIVRLPTKNDQLAKLGDSLNTATRRFKALESRLAKTPEIYDEYKKFMQEYEEMGHMREVTDDPEMSKKQPSYYMPHHAVYKTSSTTTKLRVVFDASCKTSTGISLNDALMIGPTLQEDLFSILVRFRTFRFALTADIAKMYRQVLIDPTQTQLQRILWRGSSDQPIKAYELLTVTYGTASASYLAIRALRKIAEDNLSKFPSGASTVLNCFYVDDLVAGANTLQEVLTIREETIQLLQMAQFELRKWKSNESILRDDQSSVGQGKIFLAAENNAENRILGVLWDCDSDEFKFAAVNRMPLLDSPTKRRILARIALIFDPLGLLGPIILVAKVIMQELWRLKVDWDESVPSDLYTRWKMYETELQNLEGISVPRRIIEFEQHVSVELHGFADASEAAYGACIYLRSTSAEGKHSARLLCSKSRVAPLKSLSIPRLELCAALLLAQLTSKILKCVNYQVDVTYLWTDSTIVLAWIQSCSHTWNSFVANRIGEIQQLTAVQDWHHVSSEDNPADALSRGVMPTMLMNLQIWWTGPCWKIRRSEPPTADPSDKSSYVIQPITPVERQHAIQQLVKIIQATHFSKELRSLKQLGVVDKGSAIIKLNPFLDEMGILRVGGRLKASLLPYSAKHPMLLPGHHPFSRLLIMNEHERHLHAGPQATLAALRQNYWLVSARDVVRQITRQCVICFRSSPKTTSTIMGNLPESRVSIPARAFQTCGVDYAGPLYYKEGARRPKLIKCYLAVFVCFASKAIHIELAVDLSTEAFFKALKRFISRRGCPSDIYSDNGSNFIGAERELNELVELFKDQRMQQQICDHMTNKGIRWHFIPPRAPHHGGLWESAIKSVKRHLARITKDAHLRYEELETFLIQIEAILNSRPLTPISSDPADFTLTPGHFLIGNALTSYPESCLEHLPVNRLSRWQHLEQLRQHFWRRWSNEYLHQFQQRSKWQTQDASIHTGQMVILKEDNAPPLSWPLGRIQDVLPGADGVVRVITVRTAKGIYKRPITRLCLLPLGNKEWQSM